MIFHQLKVIVSNVFTHVGSNTFIGVRMFKFLIFNSDRMSFKFNTHNIKIRGVVLSVHLKHNVVLKPDGPLQLDPLDPYRCFTRISKEDLRRIDVSLINMY